MSGKLKHIHTGYHGVFAPNSRLLSQVTPARRGRRPRGDATMTEPEQHRAMTWARRLKRVFKFDVEVCEQCAGAVKIIACIERPDTVKRILRHLRGDDRDTTATHP